MIRVTIRRTVIAGGWMIPMSCVAIVLIRRLRMILQLSIASTARALTPTLALSVKTLHPSAVLFPDDTGDMCSECSHMSFSSVFTGECDLGIKIR